MGRKLATIRKICAIKPIEGADLICAYQIDGWWVVDQINKYVIGNLVIYCEIDSWIPHELAQFLSKGKEPMEFNGIKGEKLRTIKLKGQISQGLILSIENIYLPDVIEGLDVTEYLGIQLYEAPIKNSGGPNLAKGNFPSFLRKTDQERVQNLKEKLKNWNGLSWEVTEKLDGSSMTVYVNNETYGVCSRNLDLLEDENNIFWMVAKRDGIIEKLLLLGKNIAFQGELVGPGIQGNPYKLSQLEFYLFDVFDIDQYEYFLPGARLFTINKINENTPTKIKHIPIHATEAKFNREIEINTILSLAEGISNLNNNTEREGIVFKSNTTKDSFKAISNKFLLKEKE